MGNVKMFFVALVVFLVIDLVWLGLVAKNIYARYLGDLMTKQVNWVAAFIFYAIFIIGLVFFVLSPALEKKQLSYALIVGGFYGLITYATYDLTNLATLKNWPMAITIIDLIWGVTLSATTSGVSYLILNAFK